MSSPPQEHSTTTAVYSVRPDGIVVQRLKPGVRQELRDAEENLALFRRLAEGRRVLLLVDLRHSGPTGTGVRELYAQNAGMLLASGLLVGSTLSQMIGNFFINLNKPPTPCRLFTSEAAALTWLKSLPALTAQAP